MRQSIGEFGTPLVEKFFEEKSLTMPKKLKGGHFSLARELYVTRKKRKNLFVPVPWANRYNLKFCITFW